MNNELIERIDAVLELWQGVTVLPDDIYLLQDCKAALTQQQEAEPVGRVVEANSGILAFSSTKHGILKIGDALYLHPPKPAAQPVPDHLKCVHGEALSEHCDLCGSAPWPATPPLKAARPQVPEGYQVVPIELEATMVGKIVDNVFDGALEDWTVITDIWDAALSASKEPN